MQVEKIVSQAPWGARRAARSLTLRATCWWSPTLYAGRVEGSVGDGGESRGSGSVSLRRLWLASRERRALSRWANVLRSPYCLVFTPSPAPAVPRHCAGAISTTTGQCIATCVARSSPGSIERPPLVAGDAVDADGDGLVRPRPAVASRRIDGHVVSY